MRKMVVKPLIPESTLAKFVFLLTHFKPRDSNKVAPTRELVGVTSA